MDERGAPISIVLTGANRHDKVSAIELMVSLVVKRPAQKEQHLCADKAYDSDDLRSSSASRGYQYIKVNPRRKDVQLPANDDSSRRVYPARRWIVERTISWLIKRRSLRTRWSKKAGNRLALVQLACAHILLNLAVFGEFDQPQIVGGLLLPLAYQDGAALRQPAQRVRSTTHRRAG